MKQSLKTLCLLFALAFPALACDLLPSIASNPNESFITPTAISNSPVLGSDTGIAIANTATAASSAQATSTSANRQPSTSSTATPLRATATTTGSPTTTTRANTPTVTVTTVAGCPVPSLPSARPSVLVKSVTLAQNYDQKTDTFTGTATEFKVNSVVHTVIAVQNAPANTNVKTKWYANDVGKAAPCNTLIGESELTLDATGSGNMDFKQGPIIPVGSYRVEIYVNGVFDRVVNFVVK